MIDVTIITRHEVQEARMEITELLEHKLFLEERTVESAGNYVVFYYDTRTDDGKIKSATLRYETLSMDEDSFLKFANDIEGVIGFVHDKRFYYINMRWARELIRTGGLENVLLQYRYC